MDTPLLIFLHGPGQSPPVWQDVVSTLNPDQTMAAPWLKGLKPTEHGRFNIDQAVEAVADVLERYGAFQADVVGYSLGGIVGVRMAMAYPNKVAHLVLISTPVIPNKTAIDRQKLVVKLTPAILFKGVDKEHVLAGLEALASSDLGVDLAQVKAPTLAITADQDPLGRASSELLASEAGAMTRSFPGANPNLLESEPAGLAQLISDFCAGFLS